MAPTRYLWLVEVGWIANQVERRSMSVLLPGACGSDSWWKDGRVAQIALDDRVGECWLMPEVHTVATLFEAARPLFDAQSRLPKAKEQGAHRGLIGFLQDMYLHYEDSWDRGFDGRLDSAELAGTIREGMHLVRKWMPQLPERYHALLDPVEEQYSDLLERANRGLDLADCKLQERVSVLDVPRPFTEAALRVSSLDELRSLLPPFTADVGPEDWQTFQAERQRLAALVQPPVPGEPVASVLRRTNELWVEARAGCLQCTTEFDWRLQRIVATSERPMLDCLELFDEATCQPDRLFLPVRVGIVAGLFGMAYFDALQPKEPCCPDCGVPTTPGRRGRRNVLCPSCRQKRRQQSYRRKRRSS